MLYDDYDDAGNYIGDQVDAQQPAGTSTDTTYEHQLPYQQNTDPDNAPPPWLHDPNAQPAGNPGDGNYWVFDYGNMTWKINQQGQMNPQSSLPDGNGWQTPSGYIPSSSGNQAGYMDTSYWMSRGFPPEAIFDTTTGALRPGWTRTANGYEHTGADTSAHTPGGIDTTGVGKIGTTYGGSGGGGGYGGGSGGYDGGGFAWPQFNAPAYNRGPAMAAPPAFHYDDFKAPDAFSYEAFKAPDENSVFNDPSYRMRADEGTHAIENSAAAKGLSRLPATMKALAGWNQDFASREYGNIFDRAAQTYSTNRNNAADTYDRNFKDSLDAWGSNRNNAADAYSTNYGIARDVWDRNEQGNLNAYDRNYRSAYDTFNMNEFEPAKMTFNDLYNRWKAGLDANVALINGGND